jgi:hypothetical protein
MADINTPTSVNMLYRGTNRIKFGVVQVLRNVFANPDIVPDERYRYVPSTKEGKTWEETSKISIYRTYPKRIELFPALTVMAGAYTAELMALSEEREVAMEHFDDAGILVNTSHVGHSIVPITINILAKASTDDRENITDIVVMILRVLARGQFARHGFSYNKIEVGGENEAEGEDGEILYGNSVTINCNTDYWYVFSESQENLINSIALKVFGEKTATSPEILLHPD